MVEIVPAVLPKDYEDMKNKIALVRGHAPLVQIDICDGIFVKNKTWPFTSGSDLDHHFHAILEEREGMPFWEDIEFEFDLMVADAVKNFDIYTKLGPRRIIFHLEAVGDIDEFRDFLEGMDMYIKDSIEFGIALNIDTPVEKIFSLIPYISFVQCMGIKEIGFQGQDFDENVLEQIKKIKEKFPNVLISVDGGVDLHTGKILVDAGVERLVAGSAILNSDDIIGTIEEFKNL